MKWLEAELTDVLKTLVDKEFLGEKLDIEINSYWPVKLPKWDAVVLRDESALASILKDWEPAFA